MARRTTFSLRLAGGLRAAHLRSTDAPLRPSVRGSPWRDREELFRAGARRRRFCRSGVARTPGQKPALNGTIGRLHRGDRGPHLEKLLRHLCCARLVLALQAVPGSEAGHVMGRVLAPGGFRLRSRLGNPAVPGAVLGLLRCAHRLVSSQTKVPRPRGALLGGGGARECPANYVRWLRHTPLAESRRPRASPPTAPSRQGLSLVRSPSPTARLARRTWYFFRRWHCFCFRFLPALSSRASSRCRGRFDRLAAVFPPSGSKVAASPARRWPSETPTSSCSSVSISRGFCLILCGRPPPAHSLNTWPGSALDRCPARDCWYSPLSSGSPMPRCWPTAGRSRETSA